MDFVATDVPCSAALGALELGDREETRLHDNLIREDHDIQPNIFF